MLDSAGGVVVAAVRLLWFVDVEEARVLPGEKKAFLRRVASDL